MNPIRHHRLRHSPRGEASKNPGFALVGMDHVWLQRAVDPAQAKHGTHVLHRMDLVNHFRQEDPGQHPRQMILPIGIRRCTVDQRDPMPLRNLPTTGLKRILFGTGPQKACKQVNDMHRHPSKPGLPPISNAANFRPKFLPDP